MKLFRQQTKVDKNIITFTAWLIIMKMRTKIFEKALGAMLMFVVTGNVMAQEGLKDAYREYFDVGVAVNMHNITDSAQAALVLKDYGSLTAENVMKPESLQPAKGVFRWEHADRLADFCRRNGLKLRGHCLMWHSQIGKWMYQDEQGALLSKEVFFENMKQHIMAVVTRYKDVVYCWDVVNEAIADGGENPYRDSPMYKIAGNEFIKKAFQYAHEADPDALLFYNDYNASSPAKCERICNMVQEMKAEGVPIDGIGMQGHYSIYGPKMEDVDAAIAKYAALVDNIHITELDVRVTDQMGGDLAFKRGEVEISPEMKQAQERQYAQLFDLLRRHKDVIKSVTFWNLSDRDSWLGAGNYPLPYDKTYQPKPVYFMIKDFGSQ